MNQLTQIKSFVNLPTVEWNWRKKPQTFLDDKIKIVQPVQVLQRHSFVKIFSDDVTNFIKRCLLHVVILSEIIKAECDATCGCVMALQQ